MAFIPALLSAAGSIGGGLLANSGSGKESKMQKTQRKLVDKLLASLGGNGPYSDLFSTDEEAFQKSFVDPAKSLFKNQIAPQIQQESIYGGQQRGTGLDDQLLRAGVDLDQLLNQQYMDFQNKGKDRMQSVLQSILGGGSGAAPGMSTGDALAQATSGYLSSNSFKDVVSGFSKNNQMQPQSRRGFENDVGSWNNQPRGLGV